MVGEAVKLSVDLLYPCVFPVSFWIWTALTIYVATSCLDFVATLGLNRCIATPHCNLSCSQNTVTSVLGLCLDSFTDVAMSAVLQHPVCVAMSCLL